MNPGDDLDYNGEDLLMTLMTTDNNLLTAPMTTSNNLLMTHDDDTDDHCDSHVLWASLGVSSPSVNKIYVLCGAYHYHNKHS